MKLWQNIGLAALLSFSQNSQASEEELRAEIEKLKSIVTAQQVEIIAIRNGMSGSTNNDGGSSNPNGNGTSNGGSQVIDEIKVKAYCESRNRVEAPCVECARQHGFDTAPFKQCVKALPPAKPE